jgi:hypothetical protein
MARNLSAAQKEILRPRALQLRTQRRSYADIGEELKINRKTAKRLVEEELSIQAEHREHEREQAIAHYDEIIRTSWERLRALDSASTVGVGLLNTAKSAQERIDKLTGAEAPQKHQNVEPEYGVVWDDLEPTTR